MATQLRALGFVTADDIAYEHDRDLLGTDRQARERARCREVSAYNASCNFGSGSFQDVLYRMFQAQADARNASAT